MRLHKDAERKEERMRARRRHAEGETEAAANLTCHPGGNTLQDRLHSMAANARSSSSGSSAMSSSGGAPSAAFYKRQEAAWQRRGERVKQKRPSDEDELKECTCKRQPWLCTKLWCLKVGDASSVLVCQDRKSSCAAQQTPI